jgi:hypothetical protein
MLPGERRVIELMSNNPYGYRTSPWDASRSRELGGNSIKKAANRVDSRLLGFLGKSASIQKP